MNCRLPLLGLVDGWRVERWRVERWRVERGRVDGWRVERWRGERWRGEEKRRERRVRARRVGKRRKERAVVGRIERREGAKRERSIGSVGWREEERVEEVGMEDGGDDQNSF